MKFWFNLCYQICFLIIGCEPKKIWMVIRHGTRNPNQRQIGLMNERLPEIRKLILNSDNLPNGMLLYCGQRYYLI